MGRRVALGLVVISSLAACGLIACDSASESLPEGCTAALKPSADDAGTLQEAFIAASSGDVVCLRAGTYQLDRELSVANHQNITIRGVGATRDDVVLDFAGQTIGDDGVTVTADGFTIRDLTIKNTPGNGIVVHADTSLFQNLKVTWDAGSVTDNGAYAVYPNDCSRTIVEDSEIVGAADAGIYVGSCEYAIVRRNTVHANVAGIEIENSRHADVYENTVYDNTAGILVFVLPNLRIKEVREVLIRDNTIYENNRDNFAEKGSIVSFVPKGLGMLTMGAKQLEIRDNEIRDNVNSGMLVVSFGIMETLAGIENTDADMDPYTENVWITGNTFSGNGTAPAGALIVLGEETLPDVLWDGDVRDGGGDPMICLGPTAPSFLDFDGEHLGTPDGEPSTDTTGHLCTLTPLPELTSFDTAAQ
ncbi:MAG: hypothetical protein CVU56_10130 [Deltaproteobacteria bacterium HGW-Deltaproteobacteria-14]|jgi:parallel beta-helix repeat protein|nr:MAG: hypothetical protein CVU56_10130 [Deltaproteobacteria bacterium HGW-Deltaproteobacteria-14]